MNWLRRFMYGRYGGDQLMYAILVLYLLLSLAGRAWDLQFLNVLAWLCLFLSLYRVLSRDRTRRQYENQRFLCLWQPIARKLDKHGRQIRDFRTHRYYTCPGCGQALRVPKGKGIVTIHCPKCRAAFDKKS